MTRTTKTQVQSHTKPYSYFRWRCVWRSWTCRTHACGPCLRPPLVTVWNHKLCVVAPSSRSGALEYFSVTFLYELHQDKDKAWERQTRQGAEGWKDKIQYMDEQLGLWPTTVTNWCFNPPALHLLLVFPSLRVFIVSSFAQGESPSRQLTHACSHTHQHTLIHRLLYYTISHILCHYFKGSGAE